MFAEIFINITRNSMYGTCCRYREHFFNFWHDNTNNIVITYSVLNIIFFIFNHLSDTWIIMIFAEIPTILELNIFLSIKVIFSYAIPVIIIIRGRYMKRQFDNFTITKRYLCNMNCFFNMFKSLI